MTTAEFGTAAVGTFIVAATPPHCRAQMPILMTIETVFEELLATATSALPSLLKSPAATDPGFSSVVRFVGAPKVPLPFPNRNETLFEPKFATATSVLPSPSKSPASTEIGFVPAA